MILLIEDNADVRDAVATTLELSGYTVRGASTAQEALDILAKGFIPRLIIVDLMLGGEMDGLDFRRAQLASTDVAIARIPAIAYSAFPAESLSAAALQMPFFLKPMAPEKLVKAVQHYALPKA